MPRKFTQAEDAAIRGLAGLSNAARSEEMRLIAAKYGRSVMSIRKRAHRMGVVTAMTKAESAALRHVAREPKPQPEKRKTVAVPCEGNREAAIAEWKRINAGKEKCPPAYVAPVQGAERLASVPVYEAPFAEQMTRLAEAKSQRDPRDRLMDGVRLNTGVLV